MTKLSPVVSAFDNKISDTARKQHDEIYRLVGEYVVAWATTESLLIGLFQKMLSISHDNAALLYYSNQSNYAKIKLLRNLAKANLPIDLEKEFSAIASRFKAPTRLRNELVHSEYSLDLKTMMYTQTVTANLEVYDGGDPVQITPIDHKWFNRVKTMAKSLSKLNKDIWVFIEKF